MFGFRKKQNFAADVGKRITDQGQLIDMAIASQLDFANEKFGVSNDDAWQDAYTRYYIFGAIDSLTCDFPIEIRQRVAPGIIRIGFERIATMLFDLNEANATKTLEAIFLFQSKNPTYPPIIEGGIDGQSARQGRPATRLLANIYDRFKAGEYSEY